MSNINIQIQRLILYLYTVYKVFTNTIGIGNFMIYISAATKFSDTMSEFLNSFIGFRQMCKYLELYMQFEQIPSRRDTGNNIVPNKNDITIEFKNVYFRYPRSKEYTLKGISIVINKGEKLSVVGQNGAGKTTFIKLLCRLYEPEKGEILVNGVNIKEYEYSEYMNLLAVVFQDFKLFSFNIKQNIVFNNSKNVADEVILSSIKKVGLYEKISSLDKGIYTSVYKTFDKNGIEFSGGESQRLSIARAIFKNPPIVVLDEPTAALDPYAEYEIYSRFNDIVWKSTAIFISHRLSSCQFCDKIAVFEDGKIIQYGSHSELVKKPGKYAKMWRAQAQYYI